MFDYENPKTGHTVVGCAGEKRDADCFAGIYCDCACHGIRTLALIAALREAQATIARVREACADTTEDCSKVNGHQWTDGYEAMLGVARASLE